MSLQSFRKILPNKFHKKTARYEYNNFRYTLSTIERKIEKLVEKNFQHQETM